MLLAAVDATARMLYDGCSPGLTFVGMNGTCQKKKHGAPREHDR